MNLTLSYEVAEEMVNKYKCIKFFVDLVSGTQLKHAQFSAIALGNLARKEVYLKNKTKTIFFIDWQFIISDNIW